MLADDGSVAAVLDWEICTLGDPLADVGLLWVYWTDPGTTSSIPQASPTALDGFLRRDEVLDRYSAASGRDLSGIDFYIAFGTWKLACIIAGVYSRYAAGAMGTDVDPAQIRGFATMVEALADSAEQAAAGLR
jgi:aminoglycoside phosphotransferase (APT) family kinase protein